MKQQYLLSLLIPLIGLQGFTQTTYVPDDNFEQALIDLGHDSAPLDDYVPTDNISSLTTLNIENKGISDLTGIEDFTALEYLYCSENDLTGLDLSNNTSLLYLDCNNNNLTSLDLSNNTLLTNLVCYDNNIGSLDLSNNTVLRYLDCKNNALTSLNVSSNTLLTSLICSYNNIGSLELTTNTVLENLDCNTNTSLTTLDISQNNDLETLICNNTNISNLDLSNKAELTILNCAYTALTDLDLSDNIALQILYSNNTSIGSLDVSNSPNLTTFHCQQNSSLTQVNLQNGNNSSIFDFFASNCPNLTCVEVDDVSYSTTNWTFIDDSAAYSTDCFTLGVEEPDTVNQFALYPNPTNNILNIQLQNGTALKQVNLYNNLGQHLLSTNKTTLNVSHLNPGIYFVEVETNQRTTTKKLIKK